MPYRPSQLMVDASRTPRGPKRAPLRAEAATSNGMPKTATSYPGPRRARSGQISVFINEQMPVKGRLKNYPGLSNSSHWHFCQASCVLPPFPFGRQPVLIPSLPTAPSASVEGSAPPRWPFAAPGRGMLFCGNASCQVGDAGNAQNAHACMVCRNCPARWTCPQRLRPCARWRESLRAFHNTAPEQRINAAAVRNAQALCRFHGARLQREAEGALSCRGNAGPAVRHFPLQGF